MELLFSHISHWTWWIIGMLLIIAEIFVSGSFLLWMGISAVVIGTLLYVIPGMIWEVQITLFAVLSLASIILYRRYMRRYSVQDDSNTLNQRGKQYIGMQVPVAEPVVNGIGKVRIEDTLWRARGPDVAEGVMVKITGLKGVTFEIEKAS